jgi:DNA-binding transcriptional LysR family regulator
LNVAEVVRRRADWDDIRIFWAVGRLGSFSAAAKALEASLTRITRTVDRLERQLNTKLFERGPLGASLTEAGAGIYDLAFTMERSAETIENLVFNSESALEGRVKIAARDGLAGLILSTQLPGFLDDFPLINVVLDTAPQADKPLAGEIDITLTFSPPPSVDLVCVPLAHFHFGFFGAPAYLEKYGTPGTIGELAGHGFIHQVAHIPTSRDPDGRRLAFISVMRKRFVTNSSASSFAAIRAGCGLSVLPTAVLAIAPELVLLDLPVTSHQLWLVRHRDVGKTARIRQVETWLRQVFDPKRHPWYRAEFIRPGDFEANRGTSERRA